MMDEKQFDRPVTLELGRIGAYRRITNAREAAECLMTTWPLNRGRRHQHAVDTCLKALEGETSADDARQALVAAAEESDVLAPPGTRH